MKDSSSTSLLWISSTTSIAPSDRSRIRREVMQKVALRRKKEPRRPHPNRRQIPTFLPKDDLDKTTACQKYETKAEKIEIIEKEDYAQFESSDSDIVLDNFHLQNGLTHLQLF